MIEVSVPVFIILITLVGLGAGILVGRRLRR